jgi:hypothetical protein
MSELLLLSLCATPGGEERALVGSARRLRELGFSPVAVRTASRPLEDWLDEIGCETYVLAAHRIRQAHRTLQTVAALRQLVRSAIGASAVVLSRLGKFHSR